VAKTMAKHICQFHAICAGVSQNLANYSSANVETAMQLFTSVHISAITIEHTFLLLVEQ